MRAIITEIMKTDRDWLPDFLVRHWGSAQMVYSQSVYRLDRLPGFVARIGDEPVGLVTYEIKNDECQIVSLDSLREGRGIGSALMGRWRARRRRWVFAGSGCSPRTTT